MTDKTIDLDQHRGMAAQKATDLRRLLADVEADQFLGVGASRSRFAFSRRRGSVLVFLLMGTKPPPTTANSRGGRGTSRTAVV
jgi:hypothetical protein